MIGKIGKERKVCMDNKEFKYVFFDWGYTLISKFSDTDTEIEQTLEKYSVDYDDFFKIWRNYHYLHSLGRISNNHEKYEQISRLTQISLEDLESIGKIMLESHILTEDTRNIIEELYDKGYILGIISNNIAEDVDYIIKRENIKKYFTYIVCSSVVGVRKPALEVYLKAFEQIPSSEYSKILFISDEISEDLSGAKLLGVKTVWLNSAIENRWKKKENKIFDPDYCIKEISELSGIL